VFAIYRVLERKYTYKDKLCVVRKIQNVANAC
jgi:hypothetical protein